MFFVQMSRPLPAVYGSILGSSAWVAYRCLATLTVGVGIYGQYIDSRATTASVSWMCLHTLFGAVMYCAVSARFVAEQCDRNHAAVAAYDVSRHLSRLVYLLLYGLVGVAVGMTVLPHLLGGMVAHPPWRSIGTHRGSIELGLPFREAFQPYVVHGIVALCLIRIEALAFLHLRKPGPA